MRALVIESPGVAEVKEVPTPSPGPGEVLIRVAACGICGTDVHIFRGEYMGDYPLVPGHEFAGEIVALGKGVRRFRVGDRVAVEPNIACGNCEACLNNRQNFCENWQAIGVTLPGGMAEYVVAPEPAVFAIGTLAFAEGAFVEPLSCVVHGVERAGIRLGDRVVILGAGPIGLLMVQTVRLRGAVTVTVLERQAARRDLAARLGASQCVATLDELAPGTYDVVIDATGVPEVMSHTLSLVRKGGSILLFGVPPRGARLVLDAFAVFEKGVRISSSYTSLRNSYQAVGLLSAGQVRVDVLISHRLPLAGFEKGVHLIETGAEDVKKVILCPQMPDEGG